VILGLVLQILGRATEGEIVPGHLDETSGRYEITMNTTTTRKDTGAGIGKSTTRTGDAAVVAETMTGKRRSKSTQIQHIMGLTDISGANATSLRNGS
jgi:hypothetical protein